MSAGPAPRPACPASQAEALARAIRAVRTKSELARRLGIRPQAIDQWDRVPAERALDVERITGVSRYDLRPDIYGAPPSSLPAVVSPSAA